MAFLAAFAIAATLTVALVLAYLGRCWRDASNPMESASSRYPLAPFAIGPLLALAFAVLIGLALLRGFSP